VVELLKKVHACVLELFMPTPASDSMAPQANPVTTGYLYKKGNLWILRFYDNQELPDGTIPRVQKAQKLGAAVGEYRAKAAARKLAEEFLAPLNDTRTIPKSVMSLGRFVEGDYLPFVETHRRVSTYHGYQNMWFCTARLGRSRMGRINRLGHYHRALFWHVRFPPASQVNAL
jgi:hypothetical protein